jgi:O-antigen ligase
MRGHVYLIGLTIVLGYTAFARGGFTPWELNFSLAGVGVITILYWALPARSSRRVPPLGRAVFWPLLLLCCYIVLQVVPLPLPLLRVISPVRAGHVDALRVVAPDVRFAAISLAPSAALGHLLRAAAYLAIFLTVRDIVLRRPGRAWAATLPLIVVGALEAVLGLLQYWEADGADKMAQGTYPNHSHYADLLGIVLPFAIMYAVVQAQRDTESKGPRPVLLLTGTLLMAVAVVLFLAIVLSLSGSGFTSCLASLAIMGILRLRGAVRPGWRWAAVLAVLLLTAAALIVIPPDPVVARLAGETRGGEGGRPSLWNEAIRLFPSYPVFGTGLGGFESALFQRAGILHDKVIDYAHNDWLQLLVELGAVGFTIGVALVAAIVIPCLRAAPRTPLALACTGSLAAFLIHCVTNFNFYAPANTMAAVTAAALATSVGFTDFHGKDADL